LAFLTALFAIFSSTKLIHQLMSKLSNNQLDNPGFSQKASGNVFFRLSKGSEKHPKMAYLACFWFLRSVVRRFCL